MEHAVGANDPTIVIFIVGLANEYLTQGKYAEAEQLYTRALEIKKKDLSENSPETAKTLAGLASVYQAQGKFIQGEELLRRALTIQEGALGSDHPDVADLLNNLAILYDIQGKNSEAEGLFRRSLEIREKIFGTNHPKVTESLNNLAALYQMQGRYKESALAYERVLALLNKTVPLEHPDVAGAFGGLAIAYNALGRNIDAERLDKTALMINERSFGSNHIKVAHSLNALGVTERYLGKYRESQELLLRALDIRLKALGANHPDVAQTLYNLALLSGLTNDAKSALNYFRKTTEALIAHTSSEQAFARQDGQSSGLFEQRAVFLKDHLIALATATNEDIESAPALGQEAFTVAQWANQSSTAVAVQQMGQRIAVKNSGLAVLVREGQDLAAARRTADRKLIVALSQPAGKQDPPTSEALRRQIADIDSRSEIIAAQLKKRFPNFADLTNPDPLKIEYVQNLLRTTEVIVFFVVGKRQSYVFALTGDAFEWKAIPIGADDLSAKVAAFRRGLDVNEFSNLSEATKPTLFDLGLSFELYTTLFGSVETLVMTRPNLLVVPSGALTALPFHLLVTEKPTTGASQRLEDYRDAAWLVKRQAVDVLPSVASLKMLRAFENKDQATKPMIGFGNPVFNPSMDPKNAPRDPKEKIAVKTRAYSEFWRGAGVDRDQLMQALSPLPDTAIELKAVAATLGALPSDVILGQDATETAVKRVPLSDYRIVYFATHALVAGDVKGLGEPALALSIPRQPTEVDDGLLTANEVAQLKLNADWVVLSACNTIAGDKPGAEALSGLARAFFYAGARALLVSHWAVDSEAATRLTTSTFEILKSNPSIGRSEALRRAMIRYLNDPSSPKNAYPALWGPFALIGEGAVR